MKKVLLTLLIVVCFVGFTEAKGKIGIGVQGGVALPMGDFGDLAETGFGGTATFMYFLNDQFVITGMAGYLTWNQSYEYFGGFGTSTVKAEGTFSLIPITGGVRYLFTKKGFQPYVSGELGMFFASADVTVEYGGVSQEVGSASDSEFGFGFGGGFLLPVGKTMNLDVNAKYYTAGDADWLAIMAGLAFGLN